jgi:hypothetical protein
MGVAKGNSHKRHDRARAQALRAEDVRSRADARARRHFDAVFERAIDPDLPPAGLAALIMDELPDSVAAARIARTRAQRAEESATPAQWLHSDATFAPLAETARVMLAARPASPPPGVLAFAAVAAHFAEDEAEARRHADALLDTTRAAGDDAVLELAEEVLSWTHPQQAVEIAERYAAQHHRKRNRARLVQDVASIQARGQAVKREVEAVFAAEKDGGRAAAEMLGAMRQRVLEAPSFGWEDLRRDMRKDRARLARKMSEPLRSIADKAVAGAYLERALTELSRLTTTKDTAGPDAT